VGELRLGSGISMLKDGWQKWSRAVVFGGSAGGEKKGLTCGAHMSVTGEEKRQLDGTCKPKGKTPFGECTKAFRDWAVRGGGDLRGKVGRLG
jgi:hypothetical protein